MDRSQKNWTKSWVESPRLYNLGVVGTPTPPGDACNSSGGIFGVGLDWGFLEPKKYE